MPTANAFDRVSVGMETVPANVGELDSTTLPVPVLVVVPVPPLTTANAFVRVSVGMETVPVNVGDEIGAARPNAVMMVLRLASASAYVIGLPRLVRPVVVVILLFKFPIVTAIFIYPYFLFDSSISIMIIDLISFSSFVRIITEFSNFVIFLSSASSYSRWRIYASYAVGLLARIAPDLVSFTRSGWSVIFSNVMILFMPVLLL